jgi:nucleoside-diphosphate-sugar epimerase
MGWLDPTSNVRPSASPELRPDMRVAILGASGFIGSRTVEKFHLGGRFEGRAIVRSTARLAGTARFGIEGRVADAFDRAAVAAALAGCDVVIHAIAGDHRTIVETAEVTYRAAAEAGVKRMIYLSSASVHGQSPVPGTDETSPLQSRQPIRTIARKSKLKDAFLAPLLLRG